MIQKTIGELATELTIKHQRSVPDWKLRRICDALFPTLPRAGRNRVVTVDLIPQIEEELRKQNWLPSAQEVEA